MAVQLTFDFFSIDQPNSNNKKELEDHLKKLTSHKIVSNDTYCTFKRHATIFSTPTLFVIESTEKQFDVTKMGSHSKLPNCVKICS